MCRVRVCVYVVCSHVIKVALGASPQKYPDFGQIWNLGLISDELFDLFPNFSMN